MTAIDHLTDYQTERALISACLGPDRSVGLAAACDIEPADFALSDHGRIWEAIQTLKADRGRYDRVLVAAALDPGAHPALDAARAEHGSPYMAGDYAQRLCDLARRRQLLSDARGVVSDLEDGTEDTNGAIDRLSLASKTAATGAQVSAVSAADVVTQAFDDALARRKSGGELLGYSTGLRALDAVVLGLQRTDLVIVAGRPGMGKSALASQVMIRAAQAGARCLFMSLEMGREQIGQRWLSSESGVLLTAIRKGRLNDDDEGTLRHHAGRLYDLPICVDDRAGLTLGQVYGAAQRMAVNGGLDLLVIDYLQLMRGSRRNGSNREQEIAEISRGLKGIAKSMDLCVMALAQINRGVESRADKRPMMSDLRESGAIEQDADQIWFCYRPAVYDKAASDADAEIVIAKHRAGETGCVPVSWHGATVTFSDAC